MEEQIRHYCLNHIKKLFIFFILLTTTVYFVYFFNFKKFYIGENIFIKKGTSFSNISKEVIKDNNLFDQKLYTLYLFFWDKIIDNINYGEFKFERKVTIYEISKIISNPSNVFYKLTVVEGWQKYQLEEKILKKFEKKYLLNYNQILADTYFYNFYDNIDDLNKLMINTKNSYFNEISNHSLFKKYSVNEIMTIASLVEREGINYIDKRKIASVIFNRLNKNMKLQIDATTIFAITKGKYKFERKLNYNDLKIRDKFNTYYKKGLPPSPICYVGSKTIEIVLENYKTDYLFYFFDSKLGEHIFSKTFNEHKKKLSKYKNEK